MARIEHRHWNTRPDGAVILLLSPKYISTMNLLPETGTAGGSSTVQAGALGGKGMRM